MQNTMRAHSAGQISMEGGVDVNKGHMVYNPCSAFILEKTAATVISICRYLNAISSFSSEH